MSQLACAYSDFEERVDALTEAAERCSHGEDHWKDCEACVRDEYDTRQWERSLEK